MNILVKKLSSTATIPTKATKYSAGWDLYTDLTQEIVIMPNEVIKVSSGVSITPPNGYYGHLTSRSSLATKSGLKVCTGCSVMDEDYVGCYYIPIINTSDKAQVIYPNERIAQVVFLPYLSSDMVEVDELDNTERGVGGFGSSGKF